MALSCSKKTVSIIKRNDVKTRRDFYCLNCLHSFATENKRESHKEVCDTKDLFSSWISMASNFKKDQSKK